MNGLNESSGFRSDRPTPVKLVELESVKQLSTELLKTHSAKVIYGRALASRHVRHVK